MTNDINKTSFEITITESAKERINNVTADVEYSVIGLRLTVKAGGCSGYKYVYSLERESDYGDLVINSGVSSLIVDEKSAELLNGSTLDYVEDLMGGQFKITNPNAAHLCGCGESFG